MSEANPIEQQEQIENRTYVGLNPVPNKDEYIKKFMEQMLLVDNFYIDQITKELFGKKLVPESITAKTIISAREEILERRLLPYYLVCSLVFIQMDLQMAKPFEGDKTNRDQIIDYTTEMTREALETYIEFFKDGWINKQRGELETAVVAFIKASMTFMPEDMELDLLFIGDENGEKNTMLPKWFETINNAIG